MSTTVEHLQCAKCEKVIRPPFRICRDEHMVCPYCHQHQSSITGNLDGIESCSEKVFTLPVLNKIFINIEDNCQYGCGFKGKLLEVEKHEEFCIKNDMLVMCLAPDCTWFNVLSKLVSHVKETHSGMLWKISDADLNLQVKFSNSPVLVQQEHKSELFWIRFHQQEEDRYLIVIYLKQNRPENYKNIEYVVCNIKYLKLKIKDDVVYYSNKPEDDIKNNNFVVKRGVKITALEGKKYLIKLTNPSNELTAESFLTDLECLICNETMVSSIRICSGGHSTCGTCSNKLSVCPLCKVNMTHVRNQDFEHFAKSMMESINPRTRKRVATACAFEDYGCNLHGGVKEMKEHRLICWFQPTKCVLPLCSWSGTFYTTLDHWQERHRQILMNNGSQPDHEQDVNLYFAHENYFLLINKYGNVKDDVVYHLTSQNTSDFSYVVKLNNSRTCKKEPCIPITAEKFRELLHSINNNNVIHNERPKIVTINHNLAVKRI